MKKAGPIVQTIEQKGSGDKTENESAAKRTETQRTKEKQRETIEQTTKRKEEEIDAPGFMREQPNRVKGQRKIHKKESKTDGQAQRNRKQRKKAEKETKTKERRKAKAEKKTLRPYHIKIA